MLISRRTALGTDPISQGYFQFHLRQHGVSLERIRQDTILHEALATGADMLRLAMIFNLSHATAGHYATVARRLLDDQAEQTAGPDMGEGLDGLTAPPQPRPPKPRGFTSKDLQSG